MVALSAPKSYFPGLVPRVFGVDNPTYSFVDSGPTTGFVPTHAGSMAADDWWETLTAEHVYIASCTLFSRHSPAKALTQQITLFYIITLKLL